MERIDLGKLEAALAKATPISGESMTSHHIVSVGYEHLANLCRENMGCIAMTFKEESDAIAAAYTALPALLAELRHLRTLMTPEPISDKHKDGNWWLVCNRDGWWKCKWEAIEEGWQHNSGQWLYGIPTHALPMPEPPEAE